MLKATTSVRETRGSDAGRLLADSTTDTCCQVAPEGWVIPEPGSARDRVLLNHQSAIEGTFDGLDEQRDARANVEVRVRRERVLGASVEEPLLDHCARIDPLIYLVNGRADQVGMSVSQGPIPTVNPPVQGGDPSMHVDEGRSQGGECLLTYDASAAHDNDNRVKLLELQSRAIRVYGPGGEDRTGYRGVVEAKFRLDRPHSVLAAHG